MKENMFVHTLARITKKSSQPRLPGVLKRVNNLRETANQAIIYKFVQFIREKLAGEGREFHLECN